MKIAPIDYMPVSKIPSDIGRKNQKGSLYLDEDEFKKIKKESRCAGCLSMIEFRFYAYIPSYNFSPFTPDNPTITHLARSYNDIHNKDRGFKSLLGRIVDTLA